MVGWGVAEQGWRKGPWTPEEDELLSEYVKLHGEGRWSCVAKCAGLNRSGKSCRLRWVNYLRPGLKRGQITPQEEGIIIELQALWGNKWSTIARYLPGRTDNEIKNYWRTHFKKKESSKKQEKFNKSQILLQQQQQEGQLLGDNSKVDDAQEKQENIVTIHSSVENHCSPVMHQEFAYWGNFLMDDGLWSGLWNLDDQFDDHTSNCSKIAKLNQNNGYTANGGYIF